MKKVCRCLTDRSGESDSEAAEELVSMDGIDFFPKEFCTEQFLKNRQRNH